MNERSCDCWLIDTDDGTRAKATWLSLHDAVRLRDVAGQVAEGYTYGPDWWWSTDEGWTAMLEVEVEGQPSVIVEMSEVCTLTPLAAITSRPTMLAEVTRLIDAATAMPSGEEHFVQMVLDEHSTLDVTVRRNEHRCKPGPRPTRPLL